MDWIKQNNFLATFGGIMLVGILGLGFFVISNWKGYSAAIVEFDDTRSKLESLEGSSLHPNPENLKMVETAVDAYEKSVDDLYTKLKSEQPELPTDVDVTKFGEKIQERLNPSIAVAGTRCSGPSHPQLRDRTTSRPRGTPCPSRTPRRPT